MAIDRDNFKRSSSVDFGDWLTSAAQAFQPEQHISGSADSNATPQPQQKAVRAQGRPLRSVSTNMSMKKIVPVAAPKAPEAAVRHHSSVRQAAPVTTSPVFSPMDGMVIKKPVSLKPAESVVKGGLTVPVQQPMVPKMQSVFPRRERAPERAAIRPQHSSPFEHTYTAPDTEPLPVLTDPSDSDEIISLRKHSKRQWRFVLWPLGMASLFALSFGIAGLTSPRGAARTQSAPQVQGAQTVSGADQGGGSSDISLGTSVANVSQAEAANTSVPASQQRKFTLKGLDISVTSQPLPSSYNGDPSALQQVAKNMGAQESFTSQKWGTVYVLTKGQEQAALCATTQQLIVVQVKGVLNIDDWRAFVETI